jgi:putative acetyltransferase
MTTPEIRTQRPEDRDAVHALLTEAFGGELVADLADALRASSAGAAGMAYVAVDGGQVVGHTQLTRCWVDAPDRLVEVPVLSPLGVAATHQGQGVGGALIRHALASADAAGAPMVFLEGDPGYYRRFGFIAASTRGFTAPSVRIPDPAFQVYLLSGYDPSISGALVYNDIFWQYDCVGLRP